MARGLAQEPARQRPEAPPGPVLAQEQWPLALAPPEPAAGRAASQPGQAQVQVQEGWPLALAPPERGREPVQRLPEARREPAPVSPLPAQEQPEPERGLALPQPAAFRSGQARSARRRKRS
jgi:hypothetical protein